MRARTLLTLAILVCAGIPLAAPAHGAGADAPRAPYVVMWSPAWAGATPEERGACAWSLDAVRDARALLARAGALDLGNLCHATMTFAWMAPAQADALARDARVERLVAADGAIEPATDAATRRAIRWNSLLQVGDHVPPPSQLRYTGENVGVVVMDSGINGLHPDLGWTPLVSSTLEPLQEPLAVRVNFRLYTPHECHAIKVPFVQEWSPCAWNSYNTLPSVWYNTANTDTSGHGTGVAGVIAARTSRTDSTLSGLCVRCDLYGYAIFDTFVGGFDYDRRDLGSLGFRVYVSLFHALAAYDHLLDWMDRATASPVRIVHNSWGSSSPDAGAPFAPYFQTLEARGVVIVFAAGNYGGDGSENKVTSHCFIGHVVCVANADTRSGDRAEAVVARSSSRGLSWDASTWPDLAAPGTGISSTDVTGGWSHGYSGTSFAAPAVSGCIALMLDKNPSLTPAQVESILRNTAYRFPSGGSFPNFAAGAGLLDCEAAVGAA